jgi:hypothetical protein
VRILVNPLPTPVEILGDTCVCSNQYAEYSINGVLNPLYSLEWSITGGEFLNTNNIDVKDVSVKWDKTSQINTLTVTQTVILTGCKLVQNFLIKKLTLQSPERKEIIRKSTTNILISTEKDSAIHYQWGFTSISDDKTVLIDDSDRRFVQYPTIINTDNYIYWVRTSVISNEDTCSTTTIYQTTKKLIKELEDSNYSVYPNPAKSFLYIKNNSNQNTKYTIKITALTGRILYEKVVDESITLDKTLIIDLPRGIYMIEIIDLNSKTTQKLIIN